MRNVWKYLLCSIMFNYHSSNISQNTTSFRKIYLNVTYYIDIHANHTDTRRCMHTHIQTYTPTYRHTYVHTYICTYIHIDKQTYIHTYIHTYVHTYICASNVSQMQTTPLTQTSRHVWLKANACLSLCDLKHGSCVFVNALFWARSGSPRSRVAMRVSPGQVSR